MSDQSDVETVCNYTLSVPSSSLHKELLGLLKSNDSFAVLGSVKSSVRRGMSTTEFFLSFALSVSSSVTTAVAIELIKQKLLKGKDEVKVLRVEIVPARSEVTGG